MARRRRKEKRELGKRKSSPPTAPCIDQEERKEKDQTRAEKLKLERRKRMNERMEGMRMKG